MTTIVYVRRFLTDYARNRVNLLLLAVVPVVFVIVVAGSMADAAKLLGGPGGAAVHTAAAGWAAGFLAGIAMYFQTAATRDTDRRIVIAGLPATRLVAARLATGAILALFASAVALAALAASTGIDTPVRAITGTVMFAIIYLAIGTIVGTTVASPVNGTVIVLFIWNRTGQAAPRLACALPRLLHSAGDRRWRPTPGRLDRLDRSRRARRRPNR